MANKRVPKVTTTANFIEAEGAEVSAPSPSMEPKVLSYDEMMIASGFTKMLATMTFMAFGCGDMNYELQRGEFVWVRNDHVQPMLNSAVVRALREGE